jgi:hypothetical protein
MVALTGSFLNEAQTLADGLAGPGPFAPVAIAGRYSALEAYQNIVVSDAIGPPSELVQTRDQFLLAALGVGTYVDELS